MEDRSNTFNKYLYYKREDPYLCSELAPVLEGSGRRRRYPRKGTSVERVSVVFVARCNGMVGEGREQGEGGGEGARGGRER